MFHIRVAEPGCWSVRWACPGSTSKQYSSAQPPNLTYSGNGTNAVGYAIPFIGRCGVELPGRCAERVVLIVDDEEMVRQFMKRALADAGYRTLVAANGEDAVALLAALGVTVICAVISDIAMPIMNGIQLANIMAERWPMIPLLLVSGLPPVRWGGPFLAKPFAPDALVLTMEHLLLPAANSGEPMTA